MKSLKMAAAIALLTGIVAVAYAQEKAENTEPVVVVEEVDVIEVEEVSGDDTTAAAEIK